MQVCYNGEFMAASTPVFTGGNRGFKYGDGVFETGRVRYGKLLLAQYHFERLHHGLEVLQIKPSTDFASTVHHAILELCRQNDCTASARVRLAVFRGAGDEAQYFIEAVPVPPRATSLSSEGWRIDIYDGAVKPCDSLSNLKSANYLPYLMAHRWARGKGLEECLILNHANGIADGTRTNLFARIGDTVYTPPLSAGGVAGVMRRHVVQVLGQNGYIVREKHLDAAALHQASEVFVTNAIEGIRWVERFRTTHYSNDWIKAHYTALLESI